MPTKRTTYKRPPIRLVSAETIIAALITAASFAFFTYCLIHS